MLYEREVNLLMTEIKEVAVAFKCKFLYDSLALGLASTLRLLAKSAVNIAAACFAGGALGAGRR